MGVRGDFVLKELLKSLNIPPPYFTRGIAFIFFLSVVALLFQTFLEGIILIPRSGIEGVNKETFFDALVIFYIMVVLFIVPAVNFLYSFDAVSSQVYNDKLYSDPKDKKWFLGIVKKAKSELHYLIGYTVGQASFAIIVVIMAAYNLSEMNALTVLSSVIIFLFSFTGLILLYLMNVLYPVLAFFTVKLYDLPRRGLKLDVFDLSGNYGVLEYSKMLKFLFRFNFSLYIAGLLAFWLVYKNSNHLPIYVEVLAYVFLVFFWWFRSSSLRYCIETTNALRDQIKKKVEDEIIKVEKSRQGDWLIKAQYLRGLDPFPKVFSNNKNKRILLVFVQVLVLPIGLLVVGETFGVVNLLKEFVEFILSIRSGS